MKNGHLNVETSQKLHAGMTVLYVSTFNFEKLVEIAEKLKIKSLSLKKTNSQHQLALLRHRGRQARKRNLGLISKMLIEKIFAFAILVEVYQTSDHGMDQASGDQQ